MMVINLSALPIGKSAAIAEITADKQLKRRLADLGIIKGAKITAVQKSPFGNPTAYGVCETVIAIRRSDADKILIKI